MPRPKKPAALHVVDRTFRADRHAAPATPLPGASTPLPPQPPPHLTEAEAQAWAELVAAAPRGALAATDAALIESAATALASFRFWLSLTRTVAPIAEGERGDKVHPAFTELRRARTQLNECLAAASLTPATRGRLLAAAAAADDPLADWAARLREQLRNAPPER